MVQFYIRQTAMLFNMKLKSLRRLLIVHCFLRVQNELYTLADVGSVQFFSR